MLQWVKKSKRQEALLFSILLLAHFALAIHFATTTPLFESYDETGHYTYANYLAKEMHLPPAGIKLSPYDETHQPPLYYWWISLALRNIETPHDLEVNFNPPWWRVWVATPDGTNAQPNSGHALAVRIGRLMSALLGTLTVGLTFFTVKTFTSKTQPGFFAAALHGFWPLFLFLSGAITNDVGISFAGALTLLCAAKVATIAAKPKQQNHEYVLWLFLFGVSAGLGTWMKDTGISLCLYSIVLVFGIQFKTRKTAWKNKISEGGIYAAALIATVVLGVWFSDGRTIRQFDSVGNMLSRIRRDVFQSNTTVIEPQLSNAPSVPVDQNTLIESIGNYKNHIINFAFNGMFGVFGWGGIWMPQMWYQIALFVAVICGIGVVLSIFRSGFSIRLVAPLLMLASVVLAPVVRTALSAEPGLLMGRFSTPALGALCMLLTAGSQYWTKSLSKVLQTVLLGGVAMVALMCPNLVIQPVVTRPPFLQNTFADPVGMQVATDIVFGEKIALIGYSLPQSEVTRQTGTQITLYWRALEKIDRAYLLRLETFATDGTSFKASLETSPQKGKFPTTTWLKGDQFAESYYLPVWDHVELPAIATFQLTWLDPRTGETLTPKCHHLACDARVGALAVRPAEIVENLNLSSAHSAIISSESLDLIQRSALPATISGTMPLRLELVWVVKQHIASDINVFVHVTDSHGNKVAQLDEQPLQGKFPATYWLKNEIITDSHMLRLPPHLAPGIYDIGLGIYDIGSNQRFKLHTMSGATVPDAIFRLGSVKIVGN